MEYVEGKTLKQLVKRRGSLTINEVIDIMLQLTDGIAHAHDSYIIHRDIKPQNIMIMENGLVKITDFGIAMALNSTQLTQTNSVMGSVHYLPPEQANGKGASVKCDIYSLGILMFELLTGTIPFKGENAVEIALKQMKEPLPDVTLINPEIPQSIENVLIKATAKNPKNRYNDAREMHKDIETALDESRKNEKRYVYSYPENDLDDTKIMETIEDFNKQDPNTEGIAKKIDSDEVEDKKTSKIAIIIVSIIAGLLLIGAGIYFVVTKSNNEQVKIPDVSDMTVSEAEEELEKAGFIVEIETEKIESNDIEEGRVVKTSPAINRTVKKGTKITLYESVGKAGIELEDYTGMNYLEVKVRLEEVNNLNVLIEKKTIDNPTEEQENIIVAQSPKEGTLVTEGSTVTLYIPNMNFYPDMVAEQWSLADAGDFAEKYNLNLKVTEKETTTVNPGIVIWQSRRSGSVIAEGATFEINVSKEPVVEEPKEEPKEEQSNKEENNNSTTPEGNTSTTDKKENQ